MDAHWIFVYDGDGTRVKEEYYLAGVKQSNRHFFAGGSYEVTTNASDTVTNTTKYYSFAGQRIAFHDGTNLQYIVSDHLSSASVILSSTGTLVSEQRYLPFGEARTDIGSSITETDFGYTGQRDYTYIKLIDYGARWYSPRLGRFTQPDTIIPNPGNPQTWNRFSYVGNNPINYVDPTGHYEAEFDGGGCADDPNDPTDCLVTDVYPKSYGCLAGYVIGSERAKEKCSGGNEDSSSLTELYEVTVDKGVLESELGNNAQIVGDLYTISADVLIGTGSAMYNQPFTYKSITLSIPNAIGGNFNVYKFRFLNGVSSGQIRNIGRLIGEDTAGPGMLTAGLILTVAPNQIENYYTNASQSEQNYEFAVDVAGFAVSEGAGDIVQGAGSGTISPWLAIPLGIGVDYQVGVIWDNIFYPDK